jgi:hypothetical protein
VAALGPSLPGMRNLIPNTVRARTLLGSRQARVRGNEYAASASLTTIRPLDFGFPLIAHDKARPRAMWASAAPDRARQPYPVATESCWRKLTCVTAITDLVGCVRKMVCVFCLRRDRIEYCDSSDRSRGEVRGVRN